METMKKTPMSNSTPFDETDLSKLIEKIHELGKYIDKNGSSSSQQKGRRKSLFDKLLNGLGQIEGRLSQLGRFEEEFKKSAEIRMSAVRKLLENIEKADRMEPDAVEQEAEDGKKDAMEDEVEKQLKLMNKEIRKLKHQIPASATAVKRGSTVLSGVRPGEAAPEAETAVNELLAARGSEEFGKSELYREVREAYEEGLNDREKKCALCLSALAENEEVKKRMVAYWWAAEGLLEDRDDGEDIRAAAGKILDKLVALELIRPVKRKRWPEVKRFWMEPVVRAAMARIAITKKFMNFTKDGKFVGFFSDTEVEDGDASEAWKPAEKLKTVFNVEEQFPDLRVKKLAKLNDLEAHEWLLKMKSLRVLYLGNWRSSGKHHIEVEGIEFLKGLKNMKKLKLLSLQGVSRINELTDSIRWLTNLEILDLKSCHNLEVLPKEISFLKNLTHLDISNCFLIDHMPRGLSSLTKLKVLKGFVVGNYRTEKFCTLESLSAMKSLKKLSVVVSKKGFPTESERKALSALTELEKLTLSWGAESSLSSEETKNNNNNNKNKNNNNSIGDDPELNLPPSLMKLDLQCYPDSEAPMWLSPRKLENLEKLYIRGGKLGESHPKALVGKWSKVETLRLKYLAGIKMTWMELRGYFPNLRYLEKVECPLVTLCPCDEDGVWVKESSDEAQN